MSEPSQPPAPPDLDAGAGESEEVDALPVLAGQPHVLGQRADAGTLPGEWRSGALPAVQAAAVAAGGFVAGAAVVGLMHHRQRRSAALAKGRKSARELSRRGSGRGGKTGELAQIVGSRSFLVDVHLLGGPGGSR
ncbi:MAG: hypothetical protein ABR992_06915 [Solirubrobacteraceae bacterium]